MVNLFGIRREDKNKWERRVPVTPQHISELKDQHDINAIVQPSPIRIFTDAEYTQHGAQVSEDISSCPVVFAVKEIPNAFFQPGKTYVFFSHTIKGQAYNMPMLQKILDLGCTLIDYERIADSKGRRLVFFGRYAGLAGMVDTLWAFGKRLHSQNINTPFNNIKQTIEYPGLPEIQTHLKHIGALIEKQGLPKSITPLVVGFAGYGNVSQGAQEILDLLPVKEIDPRQLTEISEKPSDNVIYKAVFKEKHMVEPISTEDTFDLQDYYQNPQVYRSVFPHYLPRLSILMNCIYWDERYPRLFTKEFLKENFTGQMKLQVVGDISVDINGAIEFTEKSTTPDNPVFVYNPHRDDIIDGYKENGIAVMAVDNLPCELPRESSQAFSKSLEPFIPAIVKADYTVEFTQLDLPPEIKNAVIVHQGKLTPQYTHLEQYL